MKAKELHHGELEAIRSMPCGNKKCGAVPPFPDGSRCHPHRIKPELGYVAGNVVPRCPECHGKEPRHHAATKVAYQAGQKGYQAALAKLTPAERSELGRMGGRGNRGRQKSPEHRAKIARWSQLHPDSARENGRKGGTARLLSTTLAQRRVWAQKGGRAQPRSVKIKNGQKALEVVRAKYSLEQRREWCRKGGLKRAALQRKRKR